MTNNQPLLSTFKHLVKFTQHTLTLGNTFRFIKTKFHNVSFEKNTLHNFKKDYSVVRK